MDKDVNSELNKLLENWVKEWHKRIIRPEIIQSDIEHHNIEKSPFNVHSGHSGSSGENTSST